MVAGGIGITTLYSVAKITTGLNKKTKLFFGGSTKNDLVFREEFEKLGVEVVLFTEDGSIGRKGLATDALDKDLNNNCAVLACGPEGMLKAVSKISLKHGVNPQLSFDKRMACGFGVCLGCNIGIRDASEGDIRQLRVCKEGTVFFGSEVVW